MNDLSIFKSDIDLVKKLNSVKYPLSLIGTAEDADIKGLKSLQEKLKEISDFIKTIYDNNYGIFVSDRSKGNPVGRGGNLRRVWSGVFKGSVNKQYAAQISIVINTDRECLDVGFYFGRASAQEMDASKRAILESQLRDLGKLLYMSINTDEIIADNYKQLFDLGFQAEIKDQRVTADIWLDNLKTDPTYSSITFSLFPNKWDEIPLSTLDTYVALVMPLMAVFPNDISVISNRQKRLPKPMTPVQRAKQAEIRAKIGLDGEQFIMDFERQKLQSLKIDVNEYLIHKSLISDGFHYDILSHNGETAIHIEVKTTPRLKNDSFANVFYISYNEYEFYKANKDTYRLYRVYDIYGSPELDIVDMENVELEIESYRILFNNSAR